eukprot:gnl/TRDRNA2_/TRDRNA2_134065_c0_seq1.p1 gnl/TRDRNA2_/TRDRNA2_134065_c0~~gnl/TRDRNA2_/TRDRNA2_134065_c0_seq1.p1  ORF type:complete len:250 (+),score=23.82 gnl/TRDRNA2_/TRDRNA2_134065_c0_seq1:224-973(+)
MGPRAEDASAFASVQRCLLEALAIKRTSSTVTFSTSVAASCAALPLVEQLKSDTLHFLGIGAEQQWVNAERWPPPCWLAFEPLQVARYERGQRFMRHQDAWPLSRARHVKLQRCATLIVYLNDVEHGGATQFPCLDLEVTPKRGSALLFFPAFANGQPDERTVHCAEPAIGEKWIAQLWTVCGVETEPSGTWGRRATELAVDLFQLNWLLRDGSACKASEAGLSGGDALADEQSFTDVSMSHSHERTKQ